jgi:hypothetical protein
MQARRDARKLPVASGRNWPRPCKNAKVVYIEESDFFEVAT